MLKVSMQIMAKQPFEGLKNTLPYHEWHLHLHFLIHYRYHLYLNLLLMLNWMWSHPKIYFFVKKVCQM